MTHKRQMKMNVQIGITEGLIIQMCYFGWLTLFTVQNKFNFMHLKPGTMNDHKLGFQTKEI